MDDRSAYAAVDLGAQSGRVSVGWFDDSGLRIREVHRFANVPTVVRGELTWQVEGIFEQMLRGLSIAQKLCDDRRLELRGIGIDSWGVDYGLVDERNQLIAPVRHYRAATEQDAQAARDRVPGDESFARTGIEDLPINTAYQLCRDARNGLLGDGVTALLIPDLFTAWLCGVRQAERTIASTTGLVDRATGQWASDLIERYGISPAALARLMPAPGVVAPTLPGVTARAGLGGPVPVLRVGGHDTASAFAAAHRDDADELIVSCGTWALAGVICDEPALSEQARQCGFTNEEAVGGRIQLMRNLSGMWLLEQCLLSWCDRGMSAKSDVEIDRFRDRLVQQARTCTGNGVLLDVGDPALARPEGLIERIEEAVGSAEPVVIVHCILDSLAESFASAARQVEDIVGSPIAGIRIIGGGARNRALVEMTASRSGLPVAIGAVEATTIGNVLVQSLGSGQFADLTQARSAAGLDEPSTQGSWDD